MTKPRIRDVGDHGPSVIGKHNWQILINSNSSNLLRGSSVFVKYGFLLLRARDLPRHESWERKKTYNVFGQWETQKLIMWCLFKGSPLQKIYNYSRRGRSRAPSNWDLYLTNTDKPLNKLELLEFISICQRCFPIAEGPWSPKSLILGFVIQMMANPTH